MHRPDPGQTTRHRNGRTAPMSAQPAPARETRWGVPLLAAGVVGLLLIISYGIVSKL